MLSHFRFSYVFRELAAPWKRLSVFLTQRLDAASKKKKFGPKNMNPNFQVTPKKNKIRTKKYESKFSSYFEAFFSLSQNLQHCIFSRSETLFLC